MNVVAVGKPQSGKVREVLKSLPGAFKSVSGKAADKFKSLSKADLALYGVIAAFIGSVIGCLFSKSFKKWLAALYIVCGVGSAYLLYRKFVKDE